MVNKKGIILKGVGGFYYVKTDSEVFECKARGIFRKDSLKPFVGDIVEISPISATQAIIEKIKQRKNYLIRPPISNVDQLIIVSSIANPVFNTVFIDKLISIACFNNIEPILVISKVDLEDPSELLKIYKSAEIKTIVTSKDDKNSHEAIKKLLPSKVTVFTGNSGVGKSTLLNFIDKRLTLETGLISQKLKRGKHTTRHVELYPIENGFVADTPGFSNIDLQKFNIITREDLEYSLKEFRPFLGECKFNSCNHIGEKGCFIIKAIEEGKINPSRYSSYLSMYNEIKNIEEWKR